MNKAIIAIGLLAAAASGFIIGKKYIEKNPESFALVKQNCGEKLHSASVYCAGAIKTGSEKVLNSVNNVVAAGKQKGAKVVDKVKAGSSGFKNELDNLRDMVVSVSKKNSVEIPVDENTDPLVFEEEISDVLEEADAAEQTQAL